MNARNKYDSDLVGFYEFYEKIKRFYDYNYPLYLVPATQEDEEKYYGNYDREDGYEKLKPRE